ncbi:MAG: PilW family protein [Rhizobacter sp.]
MSLSPFSIRRRSSGFSIVELLVAMAIGLILTLAVTAVMTRSEASKRSITSVNDANQTGAYASFLLDRVLRSAGSGYAQRWSDVFGCRINASRDNTALLPRAAALPAPFAAVPTALRLAPVAIIKGAAATDSDVLAVMSGTAGFGETAGRVLPASITGTGLRLPNTLGLRGSDIVMVAEPGVGCMLEQLQAGFAGSSDQQVTFAGRYYSATGTDVNLASFGSTGSQIYMISLGNAVDNPPQFQLFGVDPATDTLVSYDLLHINDPDAPLPLAEGVVQMRALYGIDTNADGRLDAWVDPAVAPWDSATLLNGSSASQQNLRHIVAIRVGLILRTSLVERTGTANDLSVTTLYQAPTSITLFQDLPAALQQTRALSANEQKLRHRTVEATIPLRNILLVP